MPVVKMKNVTLAFPKEEIENVNLDLLKSQAFEPLELKAVLNDDEYKGDLLQLENENPYQTLYSEMEQFLKMTEYTPKFDESKIMEDLDVQKTLKRFSLLNGSIKKAFEKKNELNKKIQEYEKALFYVNVLAGLDVELENLAEIRRIKMFFGRVPIRHYEPLVESSLNVPILILEVNRDKDSSWIFVFTTPDFADEAHKILQSAYFEEDKLPVDYQGTPREIKKRIESLIKIAKIYMEENDSIVKKVFYASKEFVDNVYSTIVSHKRIYDLSKFNVATPQQNVHFISGWMPAANVEKLDEDLKEKILVVESEPNEVIKKNPSLSIPVKLANKGRLIKAFEFITEMFGTPRYGEIDPTPFITAFFIFMYGFMLGDVGHGLTLFLFGYLLYKRGSGKFGTVMMSSALSSVFFGFMYGSVFGFDWIPALWLKPTLQINQLLVISVYYGIGMLIFGMILNVINGFLQRDMEKALFSAEGIAGLVFYIPSIYLTSLYFTKKPIPLSPIFWEVLLGSAFVAMFFKKPLAQMVTRQKISLPEGFWVEMGFGMFETLISYLSNAISFVRLAAFALTHEALFMAFWVLTLMVLPTPGGGIWAVIVFILGQLMLVGLEGLVVFIQDLRLIYYEFFTKFFEAGGRMFHPFTFTEKRIS
jgi:V/A-type H+-transporting ATPase subunit I